METAVVSLVCIALIVFGGMTMSRGFITSVDSTAMAMDQMGQRDEKIMRTELTPTYVATASGRTILNVYLTNTGQTKITDFSKWDMIIQYLSDSGYYITWLPYTAGALGNNQWKNNGIYWNGNSEVFEPGIVNPGEEIRIQAQLSPAIARDTDNRVVVSTPNGVPATYVFHQN